MLILSHKDSLNRLNEFLANVNFFNNEDSDVLNLTTGQSLNELGLKDGELLLVVVP